MIGGVQWPVRATAKYQVSVIDQAMFEESEAEDDAFKEVVAAHVPLIIYNSGGMDAAKRLGAMNYVGSDEYVAGVGGGEYFGAHGVKKVLCINTLPGATNTESRCKGVADGIAKQGGTSSQLPLPSSSFGNPTAVAQAIKAALLNDPNVDGAITISAPDAPVSKAAQSRKTARLRPKTQSATQPPRWIETAPAARLKKARAVSTCRRRNGRYWEPRQHFRPRLLPGPIAA